MKMEMKRQMEMKMKRQTEKARKASVCRSFRHTDGVNV